MKCLSCQTPLEEDCNFCSECGNEVVSIPKIVLCKGKKKNGTICGAELQKGKKFCTKCGAKVDQSIFEKEEVLCACCGRAFADDEDFCADCGLSRNDISVASSSSYQNLNTNNSSACYVHHANLDVQNEEQTSTPTFPASFYAASPGNLNVFGINAPLDGESINILPEGKDNICERASADHFDDDKDNNEGNNKHSYGSCFERTESGEDEVMPSASLEEQKINRSKRKTEQSYENNLIKKKKIEDIKNNFPPNSGEPQQESLDNNTFVINVDSIIDLDNQLDKEEQMPILIVEDGESTLDIGVKESRDITNDVHIEDKNESHVKGPIQETDTNEDIQVEKDSLDIKKDEALADVEQASTSGGVKTRRNTRNNTESVSVQFHALMSPEYNLTPTDVILVQFGADELGGWKSHLHKCAIIRKNEDHYTEIKLEEDISKSLLFNKSKKIQYKYVVVRDGTHFICESYCREQRRINLPDGMKNMAEWHQYDGIVFPKPGRWGLNKFMTFITRNVKEREEREKKDLVQSVEYFLPKYYKDITSGKHPAMPMEEALTQLKQLLHTLRGVYFTERKCYTNMRDYERKISDLIIAPVLKSFKEISLSAWKESPQDSEIRMLRATMVVSALKCFNCELNLEEQELLAKGLLVRPNNEKACHELYFIEKTYSRMMKE